MDSIPHQLPKRIRRSDLQHRSEGQHADEQLGFVVSIIPELDLIKSVIQLPRFLLKMGEVEQYALQSIAFITEQKRQLLRMFAGQGDGSGIDLVQQLTRTDASHVDGVEPANACDQKPEFIIPGGVFQPIGHTGM